MSQQLKTQEYEKAIQSIKRVNDEVYLQGLQEIIDEVLKKIQKEMKGLQNNAKSLEKDIFELSEKVDDFTEYNEKFKAEIEMKYETHQNTLIHYNDELKAQLNESKAFLDTQIKNVKSDLDSLKYYQKEIKDQLLSKIDLQVSEINEVSEKAFKQLDDHLEKIETLVDEKAASIHETHSQLAGKFKLTNWLVLGVGGLNFTGIGVLIYLVF